METLDDYLKTHKCQGFRPVPHYFPDGDFISVYWKEDECYAERVNDWLTLYFSDATKEVVGCKIKGVKLLMAKDRISVEPFSPGEYLQDFLKGKGWTREGLAFALHCSRKDVDSILAGELAITPEIADRLGVAFGTSAELWMNLQASYEAAKKAQAEDRSRAKTQAVKAQAK